MSLEIVRRVRGNVHGTIDVTALENAVMCHEVVQRLRRIKQTAFLNFVFPGATHTRFEHSLGVMHLAGIAWEKLQVNQKRLQETFEKIKNFAAVEKTDRNGSLRHGFLAPTFPVMPQVFASDYNLQVLRLAALLHDIGHPPFSHSGERFLPTWEEVRSNNPEISEYLRDYLNARCEKIRKNGKDPAKEKVRHEVFSLLLVDRILIDTYNEFPELRLQIDPRDVVSVISPEITPAPTSPLLALGVYRMLNELIAGEVDIDRMDYLLRDSRECGVVYGIFDAGRILDGLSMYFDDTDKSVHLAINSSSLAAFDDYLRARQSMYLQVYFHKTSASAEAMMQFLSKRLGGWSLPANCEKYVGFDEYNIGVELEKVATERLNDLYERREFDKVLRDLLYRRRLWKMVFEISNSVDPVVAESNFSRAEAAVQELGYEYEQVSSSNYLTRFQPRGEDQRSKNYLRVIKKDDFQFPRVVPIEDYSTVISNSPNQRFFVKRLYVDGGKDDSGRPIASRVRTKLLELH